MKLKRFTLAQPKPKKKNDAAINKNTINVQLFKL